MWLTTFAMPGLALVALWVATVLANIVWHSDLPLLSSALPYLFIAMFLSSWAVAVSAAGGYLTLEYVRRTAASSSGITYLAEFGNSPAASGGWSATGTESVTPIDANWERVKVTDSQTNLPARFGRLRITQP